MQSRVSFKNLLFEDPSSNSNNCFQTQIFAIVLNVHDKLKCLCHLELQHFYKKPSLLS